MQQKEKPFFVKYALAIFTFVLIAGFSVLVALIVKQREEQTAKTEFEIIARDVINLLSESINDYLAVLREIKAFFEASQYVSPEEWRTYFESIKNIHKFPGIRTISFLPFVKDAELELFLQRARKEISPDYTITPPGRREKYFPIYYYYRFTESEIVLGFDHYASDDRKATIDAAIVSGNQTITERVKWFFKDKSFYSENGIVIYTPVYVSDARKETPEQREKALLGLISCSIIAERFFPELIRGEKTNYFDISVYLGEEQEEKNLLFSTIHPTVPGSWTPKFRYEYNDTLCGKKVTLILISTPKFERKEETQTPIILAVSGNILALVLSSLIGLQIKWRKRTARLLEEIKKSEETLRITNELLEQQNKEKAELIKEIEFEKHMLDELMENIPDAVYFKDINSRFLRFSKEALRKIGVKSQEEVGGKTDFDLFTEEHARPAYEDEQQIIKTGVPIIGKIEKETWRDGRVTYALTTKMPYRDKDGKIIGTFGISKDITELKQAQEELEKEKELLEITLESIGDGVISTDVEGRVVILNRVAEKLTGWSKEEAAGKPLTEVFVIINAETRQPALNPVERVLKTGQICGLANNTVLIAKDNTERVIADSAAPIKDKSGRTVGVVLVFRDVTDKHRREKEMIKAARLEMLERLASGLAHDFNNILTAIMGNISFAKMMLDPSSHVTYLLDQSEKACRHAREITGQLLIFTKGGEPVKKPVDIVPVIKQATQMGVYGTSTMIRFDLPSQRIFVNGDDVQLGQAITHLVAYCVEAMKKKGQLFIGVNTTIIENDSQKGLSAGKYVKIVLQDHSEGIPLEKIAKIFEPYSEHVGLGSGLGLACADMIIRRHGGKIEVLAIPQKGNTFTIYLPLSEMETEIEEKKPQVSGKPRGNRILIMDDEESICSLVKMILERDGFQVEVCYDGEEAIKKYDAAIKAGAPFDLVILDLTIEGGMGGKDVILELKKIDPGVRAVVSSGYSYDPVVANYEKYGFIGALKKPYNAKEFKDFIQTFMRES